MKNYFKTYTIFINVSSVSYSFQIRWYFESGKNKIQSNLPCVFGYIGKSFICLKEVERSSFSSLSSSFSSAFFIFYLAALWNLIIDFFLLMISLFYLNIGNISKDISLPNFVLIWWKIYFQKWLLNFWRDISKTKSFS